MTDILGERRAAARSVKADVDAIFGAPPTTRAGAGSKVSPLGGASPRPTSRAGAVGASVALGLAGIAVGALLTQDRAPRVGPVTVALAPPVSSGSVEIVQTPSETAAPAAIAAPVQAPKTAAAAKSSSKAGGADCARPGGRQCAYSVVLRADASLRRAYRRAGQAGVSTQELASYRAKWSRLRRAGAHDPDRVVRGYRAMATDLNRLARERRA